MGGYFFFNDHTEQCKNQTLPDHLFFTENFFKMQFLNLLPHLTCTSFSLFLIRLLHKPRAQIDSGSVEYNSSKKIQLFKNLKKKKFFFPRQNTTEFEICKKCLKKFSKKIFFPKTFSRKHINLNQKTHQSKPRHQLYYFKLKNNHTKHWLIFWEDISSSTTTPNNAKIRPSQTTFFSRKTFSKCNSSTYFLTSLVPLFHFFWSGCFINLARKSIQGQWNIILQKNSTFQKFKKKKIFFPKAKHNRIWNL